MSWKAGRSRAVVEAVAIAARANDVEPEEVLSRSHEKQLVTARRYVACQLRARGYSLPRIGRALGLHHTSVLHYLQTAPAESDPTGIDESGVWAI